MWWLPSHSPFSALCCTQLTLWNSIQTTLGLVVFKLPCWPSPGPPRAPRARTRRCSPTLCKSLLFCFQFIPPPMMRTFLSFAVSTLAPSSYFARVLLQCQMSIFPLRATPNPICACLSVGPPLMEALDRRSRSVPWGLKVTFLWMSDTFPLASLSITQSSIWLPIIYL